MKIRDNVIEKIKNIEFLKDNRSTNIPIILLNDIETAEKNINSISWGNYFLEKRGDFTVYLFKNEPDIFKEWNNLAKDANNRLGAFVEERLYNLVKNKKISKPMVSQILFDIGTLIIYLSIKQEKANIESVYLDELYELYQSGYIPCGRSRGKYKVL